MMTTDPIADMLTRIRNANKERHATVEVPSSKMKLAMAQILLDEGFIKGFEQVESDIPGGMIKIDLKYADQQRVITGLKRISRPGLRVYSKSDELPSVLGGLGIAMISTSKGVLTDKQARQQGIGGEVICYIW